MRARNTGTATALLIALGLFGLTLLSGCDQEQVKTAQVEETRTAAKKLLSSTPAEEMTSSGMEDVEARLAQVEARESELNKLQQSLSSRENELNQLRAQVDEKLKESQLTGDEAREYQKGLADLGRQAGQSGVSKVGSALPPDASTGECFAKVAVPPQYETVTEKVLKRQASERIEVIPAKYEKVLEKVLVEAEVQKLEVVPATFGFEEETVMLKPAAKKIVEVPAVYEKVSEKVLVREAHSEWKKGTGPVQRIDQATGDIMCLVEVPAQYKVVTKQVLKSPATTQVTEVPAVFKTVKKRVMKTPPTTKTVTIPAKYKTIEVTKMVTPPTEKRIPVPEEWQTVSKKQLVSEGRMEWRSILCDTNMTRDRIEDIQRALLNAGHDPGPIDGVIGSETMAAVHAFQKAKSLPMDQYLNVATIKALGVNPR
ncbi:MAG: hypothetical protein C0617_09255 [Desulfuromonas sp.]|nr:peptidoglycan-binding protein [Desulfuromonas sp.]PLX84109.1 MAG: hypothetical protein C0617_09255 [Desulfuromonas sp.]